MPLHFAPLPRDSLVHMTKQIEDPRYLRRRAKEARVRAGAERNPDIKLRLRSIAKNYEGIADLAEEKVRAVRAPHPRRGTHFKTGPNRS